jgi:hypothetical protein
VAGQAPVPFALCSGSKERRHLTSKNTAFGSRSLVAKTCCEL